MSKATLQRVTTFLDAAQLEHLDRLSRDSRFSGGIRLPYTLILRALVDVLVDLPIDVAGVRGENDLKERITTAITNRKS